MNKIVDFNNYKNKKENKFKKNNVYKENDNSFKLLHVDIASNTHTEYKIFKDNKEFLNPDKIIFDVYYIGITFTYTIKERIGLFKKRNKTIRKEVKFDNTMTINEFTMKLSKQYDNFELRLVELSTAFWGEVYSLINGNLQLIKKNKGYA